MNYFITFITYSLSQISSYLSLSAVSCDVVLPQPLCIPHSLFPTSFQLCSASFESLMFFYLLGKLGSELLSPNFRGTGNSPFPCCLSDMEMPEIGLEIQNSSLARWGGQGSWRRGRILEELSKENW